MAKSRARPDDSTAPPPAKRRKPLSDARTNGLDDILLNPKTQKQLAAAHTTKPTRSGTVRVNDEGVVVNTPNGYADVVRSSNRKPGAAVETVTISSDESSDDDSEDEIDGVGAGQIALAGAKVNGAVNGVSHHDDEDEDDERDEHDKAEEMDQDDVADDEDATFGERLAAQHAEPIDVEAALANAEGETSDDAHKSKQLIPSGATFSTVLTQALRTNDTALLESCFETNDLESVRNTLSRIDSRHVVALLRKIAEKISRRPGRLGNLMVWIQWVIIAHGGYLAGQPDVVTQLATLQRVIRARADGLQPLLQLKGKLDMLAAQLDLRRDIQERNARDEEDEEEAITVYVEGEEDEDTDVDVSDEDDEVEGGEQRLLLKGFGGAEVDESEEDDEEAGLGAFRNGIVKGDVEASDDSDAEEGLFDDEAEETDDDDGEDSESDEEAASEDEDSE